MQRLRKRPKTIQQISRGTEILIQSAWPKALAPLSTRKVSYLGSCRKKRIWSRSSGVGPEFSISNKLQVIWILSVQEPSLRNKALYNIVCSPITFFFISNYILSNPSPLKNLIFKSFPLAPAFGASQKNKLHNSSGNKTYKIWNAPITMPEVNSSTAWHQPQFLQNAFQWSGLLGLVQLPRLMPK